MRIIAASALSLIVLFTLSIAAQRGGGQPQPSITQTTVVPAAEVESRTGNGNLIRLAPYNVNMELRKMGQAASVHETEAELFYVIDGAGTLVTGGKLMEERRTNAENLSGTGIEGGVTKRVSKGDWILVPAGEPHQFPAVEASGLRLMSLHLPKKIN
jgi:mannose-6-phosphate isomerase-like protein (cupin superfamily)